MRRVVKNVNTVSPARTPRLAGAASAHLRGIVQGDAEVLLGYLLPATTVTV